MLFPPLTPQLQIHFSDYICSHFGNNAPFSRLAVSTCSLPCTFGVQTAVTGSLWYWREMWWLPGKFCCYKKNLTTRTSRLCAHIWVMIQRRTKFDSCCSMWVVAVKNLNYLQTKIQQLPVVVRIKACSWLFNLASVCQPSRGTTDLSAEQKINVLKVSIRHKHMITAWYRDGKGSFHPGRGEKWL